MPRNAPKTGRTGDEKLKLSDVLDEMRMSRSAFYRLRERGLAPKYIKLPNGHIRVRRADLDAWWVDHETSVAA